MTATEELIESERDVRLIDENGRLLRLVEIPGHLGSGVDQYGSF